MKIHNHEITYHNEHGFYLRKPITSANSGMCPVCEKYLYQLKRSELLSYIWNCGWDGWYYPIKIVDGYSLLCSEHCGNLYQLAPYLYESA